MEKFENFRQASIVGSNIGSAPKHRVDWVDTAKGICIIFVVMMHTTLGLEASSGQQGWMHYVVAFATPFRMPDFFLISGLFLAATINRPWRLYLDRKIVHFFYFYILWVAIQYGFKGPLAIVEGKPADEVARMVLFAIIQPFGTLWFIYLLPIFFVVTKLAKMHPYWLLGVAAVLQILPIQTTGLLHAMTDALAIDPREKGWLIVDEFCSLYFYFLIGYLFAPRIFAAAEWVRQNGTLCLTAFVVWFVLNAGLVWLEMAHWPIISILLGLAGGAAIIVAATYLSRTRIFGFLTYFGANSLVIYLAFFLPMIIIRLLLLKFVPNIDAGTMALISTIVAVVSPMIGYEIIKRIGLGAFLFHRPEWATLKTAADSKPSAENRPVQPVA